MPIASPSVDSVPVDFVAAQCPNCAGHLQVPKDRDALKCMYCGSAIVRHSAPSSVVNCNVANWLELAYHAKAAGNHAEATNYFTKVLEVDPRHAAAWLGKGIAAGWQSTLADLRLGEMCSAITKAIELATDNAKETVLILQR